MPAASRVIENEFLRLELPLADLACVIQHKPTGARWTMFGGSPLDLMRQDASGKRSQHALSEFQSGMDVWERPHELLVRLPGAGISVRMALEGEDVVFELASEYTTDGVTVRDVLYPRHFVLPQKTGNYTTWALNQGSIVPSTSTARFHHPEGYSEQAMHFHGGYQQEGDCGYLAIAETPDDLYLAMWHEAGAAASTFFHWLPSLGSLRYTRRARYTFRKGMDYKQQALGYRAYAKKIGLLVSLKEKARANPNLEKLHGGCMIDCFAAARDMRNLTYRTVPFLTTAERIERFKAKTGIVNAAVHLDGWGKFGYDNIHPDTLPPNKDCGGAGALGELSRRTKALGYLFGLHDQYIDNYQDAPSFMPENFRHQENGQPVKVNNWQGGMAYHNCYVPAKRFVKRNMFDGVRDLYLYHNSPSVVKICDPTTYYLDCFTRTVECFHPEHRLTRTENRKVQREILAMARSGNHGASQPIVLQVEHVRDFAIPEIDFSYGLGGMVADVEVVGGGHETRSIGITVPLWHLAFHDTVVLAHHTESQTENLLYGCVPWFNGTNGSNESTEVWEEKLGKVLPAKLRVMALHADIGFEPMTDHALLAADGSVEKTTFAGGVAVMVDRKNKTVQIEGGRAATKGMVPVA
ncbi:MAG TPA: DUF5696 domain-containing protein [Planctomycetota bacterium]|nr:DUF5696 domain-containing protein [Planctomycetota bacterium]